jgi:hypothetical protein
MYIDNLVKSYDFHQGQSQWLTVYFVWASNKKFNENNLVVFMNVRV